MQNLREKKKNIFWTEVDENFLVEQVKRLRPSNPGVSVLQLIRDAQPMVLPQEKHRKITQRSEVAGILQKLQAIGIFDPPQRPVRPGRGEEPYLNPAVPLEVPAPPVTPSQATQPAAQDLDTILGSVSNETLLSSLRDRSLALPILLPFLADKIAQALPTSGAFGLVPVLDRLAKIENQLDRAMEHAKKLDTMVERLTQLATYAVQGKPGQTSSDGKFEIVAAKLEQLTRLVSHPLPLDDGKLEGKYDAVMAKLEQLTRLVSHPIPMDDGKLEGKFDAILEALTKPVPAAPAAPVQELQVRLNQLEISLDAKFEAILEVLTRPAPAPTTPESIVGDNRRATPEPIVEESTTTQGTSNGQAEVEPIVEVVRRPEQLSVPPAPPAPPKPPTPPQPITGAERRQSAESALRGPVPKILVLGLQSGMRDKVQRGCSHLVAKVNFIKPDDNLVAVPMCDWCVINCNSVPRDHMNHAIAALGRDKIIMVHGGVIAMVEAIVTLVRGRRHEIESLINTGRTRPGI